MSGRLRVAWLLQVTALLLYLHKSSFCNVFIPSSGESQHSACDSKNSLEVAEPGSIDAPHTQTTTSNNELLRHSLYQEPGPPQEANVTRHEKSRKLFYQNHRGATGKIFLLRRKNSRKKKMRDFTTGEWYCGTFNKCIYDRR